jgi:hypothetical protein
MIWMARDAGVRRPVLLIGRREKMSSAVAVYELVEAEGSTPIKMFPVGTGREEVDHEVAMILLARNYGLETPFVRGVVEREGALGIAYDKMYGPTFTRWMIEHPN